MDNNRMHYKELKGKNYNDGFTLIEIIITIAIVSIVMSAIFSLNIFGQKILNKSSEKSDVQTSFRMMSDAVSKNVRYSYGVEILPDSTLIPTPADLDSTDSNDAYIYKVSDANGEKLKYTDKDGTKTIGTSVSNFLMTFELGVESRGLEFIVNGDYEGELFELSSEIYPLNLPVDDSLIDSSGTDDGVVIRILKDIPFLLSNGLGLMSTLPNEISINAFISETLSVIGGTAPYEYTLEAGTLPSGLTLSSNGVISGTTNTIGTFSFKILVVDTNGFDGSGWFATIVTDPASNPNAPNVTDLVLSGSNQIGSELTANYVYTSPPNTDEGDSIIKWWRSTRNDGTELEWIDEDTDNDEFYTLVSEDEDHFIYFTVKPIDTLGIIGSEERAFPTDIVIPASNFNNPPTVSDILIEKTNTTLKGIYVFTDVDGDTDMCTFKWYRADNNGGKNKAEIPGAVLDYYDVTTPGYYYFEVTPRDSRFAIGAITESANIKVD